MTETPAPTPAPAPPVTLTGGELFAGYGGLALGVELGFAYAQDRPVDTTWVAEFDPAPAAILAALPDMLTHTHPRR